MHQPSAAAQYKCNWFRAGDGKSGGAIVAVGTTTVGYLHQGTNWIVCQQKGGDMRNAEGYRNHWFGWTQADNDKWGWASAVDARGGDDYGQFGGGVPNCNSAHGSPPTYNGVWGSPPAPSPAATRRRRLPTRRRRRSTPTRTTSRRARTATTSTTRSTRARPRSSVTASTRTATAPTPPAASARWSRFRGDIARRWTKFKSLRVTDAPAGASVHVWCTGKRKGCPKSRDFTTSAKGSVVADEDVPQAPAGRAPWSTSP